MSSRWWRAGAPAALATLALLGLAACRPPQGVGPIAGPRGPAGEAEADGGDERSPGPAATGVLERVEPGEGPSLAGALGEDPGGLLRALDRSLAWFGKPSSRDHFPAAGVSHERARASVAAFRSLVARGLRGDELAAAVRREFDLYATPGSDGRGTVRFTGYYTPTFPASRRRTDEYRYPLYRRPEDLVVDPATGAVRGRRVGDRVYTYPTRADIEKSGLLAGSELFWLRDRFDAYLVHVQGSAILELRDGSTAQVTFDGSNGHEYVSVALELAKDGLLDEEGLSLERVRGYFEAHPEDLERYLHRNPRYVFFVEDGGGEWPRGSLGVKVTPLRSVATDKSLFPPGGVVLVDTEMRDGAGERRPLLRYMLDQDAGGAIRSPGRVDIYYGVGLEAERLAGRQYSEGRLFYLFLKAGRVTEPRSGLDF